MGVPSTNQQCTANQIVPDVTEGKGRLLEAGSDSVQESIRHKILRWGMGKERTEILGNRFAQRHSVHPH